MSPAASTTATVTLRPISRTGGASDAVWFPLDHEYVERCWTSVIGPTGVMVLRRAAALFAESDRPTVDLIELARDLGLIGSDGPRRMRRTIGRLMRLGFLAFASASEVDVVVEVAPLPTRDLRRASAALRADHHRHVRARQREIAAACERSTEEGCG